MQFYKKGYHMVKKISEMQCGDVIQFFKPKKYEFIKALESGGTGKTLLMQDSTINKKFVCKKYAPEQKEYEEEFYNRFVDEIKIMYSVYDNNIVIIFDYFLYPEFKTGYIIMEYIEGRNIDEHFQFEEGEHINSIFLQIVNAFVYLEKNNILHRDVRAANVLVDNAGTVKVIDFGFGKRLKTNQIDEQASIFLNWSASKIPEELLKEVYNVKTEIFYVGYLIKNIIEKYNIDCFKYSALLEKMIVINPNKRIESFELIQKEIAEQTFEDINFTNNQKMIYQNFATDFCNLLSKIKDTLVVERDISVIIEKLRKVLRDNALEECISQREDLIECFIKSNYVYYENQILVETVKQFYDFFVKQSDILREVILNNLYGRVGNIPIVDSAYDDEFLLPLPFN